MYVPTKREPYINIKYYRVHVAQNRPSTKQLPNTDDFKSNSRVGACG